MNIYLMVKTHLKTGLKYLCKTIQNPHKYNGSGVDWRKHLKEHGAEHITEVLKICNNQSELYYWGRYYSNLYRIVTAMDDYGNKIWANRIPETGGSDGEHLRGKHRTEATKQKIRQNKPDQSGIKNGMYQKNHTEQAKIKCGNSNRGKDIKTLSGKKSIQQNMLNQWKDPEYRNNQIAMLRNRKGEKRSSEAIASYKKAAKERDAAMTKEERVARTLKGVETKKIKYAGLTRKRVTDAAGKIKYIWVNSIDGTVQN